MVAFQAGAEADYRYAHALYNMAERIGDRHPRVAVQLEKAADALLLALYAEDGEHAGTRRRNTMERRPTRRLEATFHVPVRHPSLPSPRP